MGQYYKAYLRDREGGERLFNPQNAIYKTVRNLPADAECGYRSDGFYDHFSGMKLMEHSWLANDFVNGVVEAIWCDPCRVAWVGDYADGRDRLYTEEVGAAVWGEGGLPDGRFGQVPEAHKDGYLVNLTRSRFVDLAEYAEAATYKPKWASEGGWCIHPLPILTAIGNGKGGGDYHGACMDMVGAWAMDEIMYTTDRGDVADLLREDVLAISFREGD